METEVVGCADCGRPLVIDRRRWRFGAQFVCWWCASGLVDRSLRMGREIAEAQRSEES